MRNVPFHFPSPRLCSLAELLLPPDARGLAQYRTGHQSGIDSDSPGAVIPDHCRERKQQTWTRKLTLLTG
ncbi:uncharacterized protein B0H18DRAFT_996301 [Fomitopsis serialis]|uniref:uncharacterized protein n=1 Tax=Fomitopsis serialis TaxID=139415 RepID=UPI0020079BBD|nr:uncharacterized protein B0H18DRAFT_996301 [Neoantrodia serialis]KAH9929793.1 hypothetical protein B0H18DRAFT_996301 [Neoantrodia serialis]